MAGPAGWVLAVASLLAVAVALTTALTRRSVLRRFEAALNSGVGELDSALARARELVEAREAASNGATAQLAEVLDAFSHGVLLYDRNQKVTFANAAGSAYVDARHSLALVEATIGELLDAAVPGRVERRLDVAGPPKQTFDIAVLPLDERGFVVVVEDVTARRRLEDVRRDFVANISHELKTPVGAIALLAETMTGEEDPALLSRLSVRLHHEAMRVGRTIDDLLLLSQIEADAEQVRGPASVRHVIAETLARVATTAEERGIDFVVDDPPPDLCAVGDRRQLVSALYNLVDNALKYSEDGSVVRVGATGVGEWVELAVVDRGIGIPARDLERIFERFYRVDKGRSRRTGGTGLGLAIVRHIVGNLGGSVTVRSCEGEGSTFTLVLPRYREAGGPSDERRPGASLDERPPTEG
ncbi:MAG: hypothetical protein GEV08_03090 [Acidimicrobiia bacterium]|nr:hypothetical protein [Acidimicrobiia bacterium]